MRVPEFDGIRGLAILLVLVVHLTPTSDLPGPLVSAVNFGWSGVDVFFVLSGFLITSILLKTKSSPVYLRVFYTNRILRIFPLYYVFLIGFSLFASINATQFLCYSFYAGNFLSAFGKSVPNLNHFWSLAIEEQFYMIWPFVVLKLSTNRLIKLCLSLIAVIVVARYGVVHFPLPAREFVYTLTPLRCDALLLGALIACLHERGLLIRFSGAIKWVAIGGFVSLAIGIKIAHGTGYVEPGIARFGYLGVDLLSTSIVAASALWQGSGWLGPARSRFLVFFGKYSYGIYVLHMPISRYLRSTFHPSTQPILNALITLIVGTALSVAAALVSWNVLEKHCLALKERLRAQAKTKARVSAESA